MSTCQLDGVCTLAFLTPQVNIVPNNQTLTVPLTAHTRSKRAIQFIPLLVGLGITAGIGMGEGGGCFVNHLLLYTIQGLHRRH